MPDPRPTVRRLLVVLLGLAAALLVTPSRASANIGSYHWQYGTIYIQNVSPGNPYQANISNRILYYHNLGAHWNVVEGACRAGYPCIRLSVGTYPTTGEWQDVLAMTTYPLTCAGPATFCNSDGNVNNLDRSARIMVNTAQGLSYDEQRKAACHELGHALAYLQHEANTLGATCMNAAIGANTPEFLNPTDKQQITDRFAGIAYAPCAGCSTLGAATGPRPDSTMTRRSATTGAAGQVSRTFSAYDLTQCGCLYSEGGVQAFIYSAPLVRVTSYYDVHLYATQPYTRPTDVNRFRAYNGKGADDGKPIYTGAYEAGYALCWSDDGAGHQFDKVAAVLTVDGTRTTYILDQLDTYVYEGIRYAENHC